MAPQKKNSKPSARRGPPLPPRGSDARKLHDKGLPIWMPPVGSKEYDDLMNGRPVRGTIYNRNERPEYPGEADERFRARINRTRKAPEPVEAQPVGGDMVSLQGERPWSLAEFRGSGDLVEPMSRARISPTSDRQPAQGTSTTRAPAQPQAPSWTAEAHTVRGGSDMISLCGERPWSFKEVFGSDSGESQRADSTSDTRGSPAFSHSQRVTPRVHHDTSSEDDNENARADKAASQLSFTRQWRAQDGSDLVCLAGERPWSVSEVFGDRESASPQPPSGQPAAQTEPREPQPRLRAQATATRSDKGSSQLQTARSMPRQRQSQRPRVIVDLTEDEPDIVCLGSRPVGTRANKHRHVSDADSNSNGSRSHKRTRV
ncbi:hypothetical protein F5Y15DRAFT_411618 [Xylariaceae sp. FL0016]|nr:hypothetical protein F5Y15DRAFT_411618 [Xylariaceae sp. FL0016]